MAKTIEKKVLSEERRNRELLKKIGKILPYPALDLSDPEVVRQFCIRYGKAIAPGLREIDQWQARSYGSMFTKAVRGSYCNA